nr:hypothetical protein [Tanacetum cinerariifolium]
MSKDYNFPHGNCIHCVGVGTNVKEEFDLTDLLNVAAKTLGNGKFGSGYKAGLIGILTHIRKDINCGVASDGGMVAEEEPSVLEAQRVLLSKN